MKSIFPAHFDYTLMPGKALREIGLRRE